MYEYLHTCRCSGVSSGCGALGTSILRLFLLLNCSSRKAEGSSPHGESELGSRSNSERWPRLAKLLGRTPPSRAGSDSAIRCLASSNLRRILLILASWSRTPPNWSNRFGIPAWLACPGSTGWLAGKAGGDLAALANTPGDLSPERDWAGPGLVLRLSLGAGPGSRVIPMGMCFTWIGIDASPLVVGCCCCGLGSGSVRLTGSGRWSTVSRPVCTLSGLVLAGPPARLKIDCMGAWTSLLRLKAEGERFMLLGLWAGLEGAWPERRAGRGEPELPLSGEWGEWGAGACLASSGDRRGEAAR